MSSGRRILGDSTRTTALTIVARGLGFLVPISVGAIFGTGPETDAYFLAVSVPVLLVQVAGQGLHSGMVPVATRLESRRPEAMPAFAGATALYMGGALLVLALALYTAAPWLPQIARFEEAPATLVALARSLSPLVVLVGLSWLWSAFFLARRSFVPPAVAPGVKALVLLALLFLLGGGQGIFALAAATVVGEAAALFFLVCGYRAGGGHLRLSWSLRAEHRETARQTLTIAIGSLFFIAMPLLDRVMSARLAPGSISALEYADRIYLIPLTLAGSGLLRVLLAHWSADYARGAEPSVFRRSLHDLQGPLAYALVPLTVFAVAFRTDIVALLFQRGAFTAVDTAVTAVVLGWLMAGYLAHAWWVVLYQLLTAAGRTRVLVLVGLLAFGGKTILNGVLGERFGVGGIAASTAAVHWSTAMVLAFYVRGVLGGGVARARIGWDLARTGTAAVAAALGSDLCIQAIGTTSPTLRLIGAAAGTVPAYFAMSLLMGVPEAQRILRGVRSARWLRGVMGGHD